jgi:glycosyltransferase involved in cell wall biosynthesis
MIRRFIFFVTILTFSLLPLHSQEKQKMISLNGYLTTMQSAIFDSLSGPVLHDNLLHNRLNFKGYLNDHITFAAEFRNRLFTGDMVRSNPTNAEQTGADNGLVDMSWNIISKNSFLLNTTLDRLWLDFNYGKFEATILCRSHEGPPHPRARMIELKRRTLLPGSRVRAFAEDVERHLDAHAYDVVVGLGRTWTQDVLRLGGGCHASYLETAHAHVHTGPRRLLERLDSKHRTILEIEARALAPGAYRSIVVNSDFVRRDLVARYDVDESRVRVIRNAVDLERFHPRLRETEGGVNPRPSTASTATFAAPTIMSTSRAPTL